MLTAKVFENGRSQAVRLPKECRFDENEVLVNKVGDIVMLMPRTARWETFLQALELFSGDYMEEKSGGMDVQEREML